eukprot:TRINITY_DN3457_c0_g2_i3.p1 TRINITY_DN3457_c0_g2~~TRINITY_DN3457_c0_g2_i3.p1  ORF type:complete len:264 (-),score=59.61 TRINITY_DN3457_c0_g2_i3:52-756(-)
MWYVRTIPNVRRIFSRIWGTDNLCSSMDGCCVHLPFEYHEQWKIPPNTWFHLDQNGHDRPGKVCVQGFLNFYEAGPHDGGLALIKRSHTIFDSIFQSRPDLAGKGDWIMLEKDDNLWREVEEAGLGALKVCCSSGDFVVWDSRVIHCGCAAVKKRPKLPGRAVLPFRRLVAYVSMVPEEILDTDTIQKRREAYYKGWTTSHWVDSCSMPRVRRKLSYTYVPTPLNDEQKALIPL